MLLPALGLLPGVHGAAQSRGTLTVEENLRAEPQGAVIGRLLEGTTLPVVQVQGRWVQVELEGWIWSRSIQPTDRQGFDLAVSVGPSENLRSEPSGTILARLLEGALLDKVADGQGWTRVRRVAWVWEASVAMDDSEDVRNPVLPSPWGPGGERGVLRTPANGASILTGPDGDTLGLSRPGTEVQLLARQGNWARVRLEGWIWAPAMTPVEPGAEEEVTDLTPEEVVLNPEAYLGRVVDWELQFISREEAEQVRTDFYEGEPFLLTRATSSDRTFVYVALPPERLTQVEGLIPLERIRVVGRIRTGAAALTGNPIIDLMELTRLQRD